MNYLVDPLNITDYNETHEELELKILFWVCAAGKNALSSARGLNTLLRKWDTGVKKSPFHIVRKIDRKDNLAEQMRLAGIGCYNQKSVTFRQLATAEWLDLFRCSVEDLESIKGVGPKTARCFLIHSRRDQEFAGLDTHILKYLRDEGYEVPKSTPIGKKYRDLEIIFLNLAKKAKMSPADFDLMIWKKYRKA